MNNTIISVFKKTCDNWRSSYRLDRNSQELVEVSFIHLTNCDWRVCAWGEDDCGLEKDFPHDKEKDAWTLFIHVIGMENVTKTGLLELGFVSA